MTNAQHHNNNTEAQHISHKDYVELLASSDPELFDEIKIERQRQGDCIQMIASENSTWPEVLLAQGSVLTNKYAEGYPGRRYYGGCESVDKIEQLAIDRAKELFKCDYANVQPHSGTSANLAVYQAFINPGDKILGMSLQFGGHLTHGSKVSGSGKIYQASHYTLNEDLSLDYNSILQQAKELRPKIIIAGYSAYPRIPNWQKFREIADEVGAILMCDIAHIAGPIAAGIIESPMPFADVVTSTTHKTLRGPRSGIILARTDKYAKQINSAVFPGVQGGPLMHAIAAKAFAFKKAMSPEFKEYSVQVIKNAKIIASSLIEDGIDVVTGGTDCHLVLADLTNAGISGKQACIALERAGIVCNQNSVPFDKRGALEASGIRIGSPCITSRGMKEAEVKEITGYIAQVVKAASIQNNTEATESAIQQVKEKVSQLCRKFPVYGSDVII